MVVYEPLSLQQCYLIINIVEISFPTHTCCCCHTRCSSQCKSPHLFSHDPREAALFWCVLMPLIDFLFCIRCTCVLLRIMVLLFTVTNNQTLHIFFLIVNTCEHQYHVCLYGSAMNSFKPLPDSLDIAWRTCVCFTDDMTYSPFGSIFSLVCVTKLTA